MPARKSRPGRSPRRKVGRASARKTVFRLVVEAQAMRVSYQPNWSKGEFACGHFEFRNAGRRKTRILVSETGYLSHFAPMAEVKAARGPERYARELVLDLLNRCKGPAQTARERGQLSLF